MHGRLADVPPHRKCRISSLWDSVIRCALFLKFCSPWSIQRRQESEHITLHNVGSNLLAALSAHRAKAVERTSKSLWCSPPTMEWRCHWRPLRCCWVEISPTEKPTCRPEANKSPSSSSPASTYRRLSGWRRGSVVRTSVFGRRFPLLYAWSMVDMWVKCSL